MLSTSSHRVVSSRFFAGRVLPALLSSSSCTATGGAVRFLNVHEYISMELMQQHHIATPEGHVATTPDEAEHIFANVMNKRTWCGGILPLDHRCSINTEFTLLFLLLLL
jgi:hypothetical protein